MSSRNVLTVCCILALVLAKVTSWTIDLPEVRKYLFEKNEYDKMRSGVSEERERAYYSNVEGNSMHHSRPYNGYNENEYAKEYGYQPYMENKVQGIVRNGSVYLEGLRRAIENYTEFLENCSRINITVPQPNITTNTTWRPSTELSPSFTTTQNSTNSSIVSRPSESCRAATRASEHVRRLAELANWATRELQDLAFARDYRKDEEDDREENELILKLAWFLDKLAQLTGYEPEASQFVSDEPLSSTSTPLPVTLPVSMMNAPEQVKNDMMNCLDSNSSEPATMRCAYPLPLPPMIQQIYNLTDNSTTSPQSDLSRTSIGTERVLPITRGDPIPEQSLELLIAADDRMPLSKLSPFLTDIKAKTVRKRSAGRVRISVQKRSVTDKNPTINLVKYFVKHKVWVNSNPAPHDVNERNADKNNFQELDVKNHLTIPLSVQKRSLYNKKFKHLRSPESPTQDLSKYLKQKPGTNYVEDREQFAKLRAALENIHSGKRFTAKPNDRKLNKLMKHVTKRSIHYERMKLPRISEDPMQDVSYYVKNRAGTSYNYDVGQAARVRLALEQAFLTGNIEVVRRFGSNYNPLIPAPFYAGLAKSMADV